MSKVDFLILSIIGFLILVGVGAFAYLRLLPRNISQEVAPVPAGQNVQPQTETIPKEETAPQSTPGESIVIPREQDNTLAERLEEDPSALQADLVDVTGGTSSGIGYILRKDGQLFHTVMARLPEPTGGEFYEGWLVKQFPRVTFFSTGKMRKLESGEYFLALNADEEYPEFDQVVITIETQDDGNPERHVIEGTAR